MGWDTETVMSDTVFNNPGGYEVCSRGLQAAAWSGLPACRHCLPPVPNEPCLAAKRCGRLRTLSAQVCRLLAVPRLSANGHANVAFL